MRLVKNTHKMICETVLEFYIRFKGSLQNFSLRKRISNIDNKPCRVMALLTCLCLTLSLSGGLAGFAAEDEVSGGG